MPKFVLLVDDEPASLSLMQAALQRAGHMVITAPSGVDARLALGAARFDVVVTDIFMPDMDGLELIRHVCAVCPDTPIIAISGGATTPAQGFLQIASALGADMILPKPVSPAALRQAVDCVTVDSSKGARRKRTAHPAEASAMLPG